MLLDFFLLLRQRGIPVTLVEYLSLLEALSRNLARQNVQQFYYLCRMSCVKREQHLDQFDRLFSIYFQGAEELPDEVLYNIPEDWLKQNKMRQFSAEEQAAIEAMGGLDALLKRIKELFKEQNERHEGGNKWIGTLGTSPFGAYGYNPEGIRIGQHESRHRRATKVWDERHFAHLRDDVALETRQLKLALRRLRQLTRTGLAEELDLQATIRKTSENAGYLDLQFHPEQQNTVNVLLLLDIGGSMDDHIERCSQLFTAAKYEFKNIQSYYFHNCIYERLWTTDSRRQRDWVDTLDVLNRYNSSYKVIFVGDAAMSPYELRSRYGSVEHYNEEAGLVWLNRFKKQFPHLVWLNPTPITEWENTYTIRELRDWSDNRMFPLTVQGIGQAVTALRST